MPNQINDAYASYQRDSRKLNHLLTLTDSYVGSLIASMDGRHDDDAKQEVMIRVVTGLGRCKSSYAGWVYGLVLNQLRRMRRERKASQNIESLTEAHHGVCTDLEKGRRGR